MSNKTEKRHKKLKKKSQALMISGLVLSAVQFIVSVVMIVFIHYIGLIPTSIKVAAGIVLIGCSLITAITQRWKVPGIITKVLSVLLSIIMIIGCVYLGYTRGYLGKMTGKKTQTDIVGVYVLADDAAQSLEEINGYTCGRIPILDSDNLEKMLDDISDKDVALSYKDYTSIMDAVDALLNKKVESIIINESYLGVFEDMDGYENLESRIRCVYSQKYITQVEDSNSDYMSNDNVIGIYISGIDTSGPPNTTSRSDVNILLFMNTKTHQILMINTPRDYYVPLSISNGVRDKLTHAGIYGIDCSRETLEMLYGINVEYYLKVNFTGFLNVIDALGGVDITLDYDATLSQTGNLTVHKGVNHFNAQQALTFSRERHAYAEGDNHRVQNQQDVLMAMLKKMMSPAVITNYSGVLKAISGCFETNMASSDITDLIKMQINDNASWTFKQKQFTGTGVMQTGGAYMPDSKLYYMIPNDDSVKENLQAIKDVLNGK
mgnify:CR=1 FL=1